MFNVRVVHSSLKLIRARVFFPDSTREGSVNGQDKEISYLINDVFEGEILKTPLGKGWQFYTMVNGERLDFSNPTMVELTSDSPFKDILSNQRDLYQFIDPIDYHTFYQNFIIAYEEILGLRVNLDNNLLLTPFPAHLNSYRYKITSKKFEPIKVHPINTLSLGI